MKWADLSDEVDENMRYNQYENQFIFILKDCMKI